jgi:hypothetical protein
LLRIADQHHRLRRLQHREHVSERHLRGSSTRSTSTRRAPMCRRAITFSAATGRSPRTGD